MLGLKKGTVELHDHEEEWEFEANKTIASLYRILGDKAKGIEHIGSTAIKSIKAKPIIDIAVAVEKFDDILSLKSKLEEDGFYYRGNDHPSQLLFACGSFYDGTGDLQTHFIHVVLANSLEWKNYINFRDYLNKNFDVAKEYEKLKITLAKSSPEDRESYTKSKKEFLEKILKNLTTTFE